MSKLTELEQLKIQLNSRTPFFGKKSRIKALLQLRAKIDEPEVLLVLVGNLGHFDESIRREIRQMLFYLSDSRSVDWLCRMAIYAPDSDVAQLCVDACHRCGNPGEHAIYLLSTGQIDCFFRENEYGQDKVEELRRAYEQCDPVVKSRVMHVMHSGDRRWDSYLCCFNKDFSQCSDREIRLRLQSYLKRKDWPALFDAVLLLPMKYGFPLIDKIRNSGWRPNQPLLRSLYFQMMIDSQFRTDTFINRPKKESRPLFNRWIEAGNEAKWRDLSEDELLKRIGKAPLSEGVSAVTVLASRPRVSLRARAVVKKNDHWLIRCAGLLTGLTVEEIVKPKEREPVYWEDELSLCVSVLEMWPGEATRADLDVLLIAKVGPYWSRLSAVRKVLCGTIVYWIEADRLEERLSPWFGEAGTRILN